MNQYQVTFSSTFVEADGQAKRITFHLKKFYAARLTNELEFNLNFVIRELFNNAVEHGNEFQAKKNVVCKVVYNHDAINIEVTDEGQGINLKDKPSAAPEKDKSDLPLRSRGLRLIEQLGYRLTFREKTIIATYYWRVKNDNGESK